MTAHVHVEDDWQRKALSIGFMRDGDGSVRQYLVFQQPELVTEVEPDRFGIRPDPTGMLSLPEDFARALYEGLADHFGHSGHDTRALRRDYEAERKRVDRLIDVVTDKDRPRIIVADRVVDDGARGGL